MTSNILVKPPTVKPDDDSSKYLDIAIYDFGTLYQASFDAKNNRLYLCDLCIDVENLGSSRLSEGMSTVRFSPDGNWLAIGDILGSDPVKCYLYSYPARGGLEMVVHGPEDAADFQFTDDNKLVISSYNLLAKYDPVKRTKIWQLADTAKWPGKSCLLVPNSNGRYAWVNLGTPKAYRWKLYDIAARKYDSKNLLASVNPSKTFNLMKIKGSYCFFANNKVIDIASKKVLATIHRGSGDPIPTQSSSDGKFLAGRADDKTLTVYDGLSGKVLYRIGDSKNPVSQYWGFVGKYGLNISHPNPQIYDLRSGKLAVSIFVSPESGTVTITTGTGVEWTTSTEWQDDLTDKGAIEVKAALMSVLAK